MKYRREVITPQKAKQLLKNNISNRKISQCKVDKYSSDMKKGYWEEENPQGSLIVLENGNLKDGQHRLSAVIKANKSIEFTICETKKSYIHFDEGGVRTPANIMQLQGIPTTLANKSMTSIATLLLGGGSDTKSRMLTSADKMKFIVDNQELLLETYRICKLGSKNAICRVAPMVSAVFEALKSGEEKSVLERFCTVVNNGFACSEKEYVAIVVRNQLLDATTKQEIRSSALSRWNMYGLFQEYIHLFSNGSARKTKLNKPTFYYYLKNSTAKVKEEVC